MNAARSVHRSEKSLRSRFARIDNALLQDDRLSFRARGVAAYVLSKPQDWRHSAESLAHAGVDGVDSIRSALKELASLGYARLEKVRGVLGRVENRWIFCESPTAKNPESEDIVPSAKNPEPVNRSPSAISPAPGRPPSGEPPSGSPAPGKPPLFQTTEVETTVCQTTENETTGGASRQHPTQLIPFPWIDESALPEDIRDYLRKEFPNDPIRREVLSEIRGRKLQFRDTYPIADWPDVVRAAISEAASKRYKNTRGFIGRDTFNGQREHTASKTQVSEPEGWKPWARDNLSNPEWADKDWNELTPDTQRHLAVSYQKHRMLARTTG